MTTSNIVDQTGSTELTEKTHVAQGKWKAKIQEVIANIPFTRRFRRRIQKLIVKDARESLQKFTSLQALDANTKQNLQRRVRNYENHLAVMEEGFLQIAGSLLWIIVLFGIGVLGIFPLVALGFKLKVLSVGFTLGYLLALLIMVSPTWALQRADKLFSASTQVVLFFVWITSSFMLYGFILQLIVWSSVIFSREMHSLLLTIFWTAFIVTIVLCALFLLFFAIVLMWIRYVFYRYPDHAITDRLIRILSLIETNPQRWGELRFKKELVLRLETLAACLASDLPRQLRSDDALTDVWFAELTAKSAAAVRSLKKWVITPKHDTREQLIARLTTTLALAASGNWDGLEQAQPEVSPDHQKPWFYRLASLSGRLLSAFSLLILSWVLQYTPIAPDKTFTDYLTIAGVVVATFGITTMLDPFWLDKWHTVKEFLEILPLTGKNK
jgi:hypothetical protein